MKDNHFAICRDNGLFQSYQYNDKSIEFTIQEDSGVSSFYFTQEEINKLTKWLNEHTN